MPAYVILTSLTAEGLQHAKQIPAEIEAAKRLAPKYSVTIDRYRMLMGGEFDFLAELNAPDDKKITEFVLAAGLAGYAKPAILQAFNELELKEIFDKL
jgi:uncharacterized protein with GYD domain